MADFKLLGNQTEVQSSLAKMTQGIGYPLRDVEDSLVASTIIPQRVLTADSFVDQNPVAVDTPLQITFGPAQAPGLGVDVDAAGNFTCTETGIYQTTLRLQVGRVGNPGVARVFIRVLLNGAQAGNSVFTQLDDSNLTLTGVFEGYFPLTQGDIVTVEVMRDSAGINEGGLFTETPVLAWNPAPSARVTVDKFVLA